jgi:glycosyltransferase involved in cell wall biosynthesis
MKPTKLAFLAHLQRDRVLYVIQHHDWSGAELFAAPVMRSDADALLACPPGTRTEEWARSLGIPVAPLPHRPLRHSGGAIETLRSAGRGIVSARDLRALLRAHPERRILYCTSLRPGLLAALAGLGLGRRAVWVLTEFPPPAPLRQAAQLLARLTCRRVLATSRVVAADFARGSQALAALTEVLYPGVSMERFADVPGPGGDPRATILGSISPTKRTDLALDVAARVAERVPDFELRVVGRAQYRADDFALEERLRRRVAQDERLARHVRFAGHAGDVAAELARCRLLLHCRPDEPFGIVLTEAMAAGLPVVAPAAAGPLEIVEHGVTGLLYPPGDADAAADHVARLAGDLEEARRMGAAGRERVARLFSERVQLEAVDRILAAL